MKSRANMKAPMSPKMSIFCSSITTVPRAPRYIVGVCSVRGLLVAVVAYYLASRNVMVYRLVAKDTIEEVAKGPVLDAAADLRSARS